MSALPFALDEPIPATFEVGRGALLVVRGWIAPPPGVRVRRYRVELDGEHQYFDARGEIRFELPRLHGRPPIGMFLPIAIDAWRTGTRARLRVIAEHGWSTEIVDQAISFAAPRRELSTIDTPIAICLATYDPDQALLARQLDSLRAQTRRDWTCVVHDDGSRPDKLTLIERLIADDGRFVLVRGGHNRGFYRNFEAALSRVPSTTPYVALCDQDDHWHPSKLERTIDALEKHPHAQLAYCDMRVVDGEGRLLGSTYWQTRRNNYRHLDTLLLANTVTGAASLFRGTLLDALVPFPPPQGLSFHDHWLACVAFVAGGIVYLDQPLYDYTQHAGNVVGHSTFGALSLAGAMARHVGNALEMMIKPRQGWDNLWTMLAYYHSCYRRVQLMAQTLRMRFADLPDETAATLALFDDRSASAFELMTGRHLEVLRRGDTTDMAEFKMGLGKLLHQALAPLLPSLVGIKDQLISRASGAGRGTPSTRRPAAR